MFYSPRKWFLRLSARLVLVEEVAAEQNHLKLHPDAEELVEAVHATLRSASISAYHR